MFIKKSMVKRDPEQFLAPTLVIERLRTWGAAIRKQRVAQRMRANDLSNRIDISHPTLRRLERGEPTVAAGSYLAALHVLGLLDQAAPALALQLFQLPHAEVRARVDRSEDDDYF